MLRRLITSRPLEILFFLVGLLVFTIDYFTEVSYTVNDVLENATRDDSHVRFNNSSVHHSSEHNNNAGYNRSIRLPGIIQAGVQKSGSSALSDFLHRAGICLSRPHPTSEETEMKEVHFFDQKSLFEKGVNFYSDLFAHCENTTLAMDGTPNTFQYPKRVRDIYDSVSKDASEKLKIIIVVREPVARELSRYNHNLHKCHSESGCSSEQHNSEMLKQVGNGTEFRTFSEYIDFKYKHYTNFGELKVGKMSTESFYGDVFEEWLQYFDRRQILVLSYDELKHNEQSFLNRVVSFLELKANQAMIQGGTDRINAMDGNEKVELPSCDVQEKLSEAFSPSTKKFYKLMDSVKGKPPMEQNPFPRFILSSCTNDASDVVDTAEQYAPSGQELQSSSSDTSMVNFLSFDLGGSGLRVLGLSLSDNPSESRAKIAKPNGNQVNLGYAPGNNTVDWVERVISENFPFKSRKDWPAFAFSGSGNTYKLFGRREHESVAELVKHNTFDIACADVTDEVPSYAENIKVWCKQWHSPNKVLGFSRGMHNDFKGSSKDGRAHFEGARARLEEMYSVPNDMPGSGASPFVFVNWGLGTGQTIGWTRDIDSTYDPTMNKTASAAPQILSGRRVSHALSSEPKDRTHEITVKMPKSVLDKHISLDLDGWSKPMQEPLPFWMIFDGAVWLNPSVSNRDIKDIYKSFFSNQVMNAINSGKLPKPHAMVFSGGQQDHFGIAELVQTILEKQGIASIAGYHEGVHCGIVRLSYPQSKISCQFNIAS